VKFVVVFGTESGTAEFVAGDVAEKISAEHDVVVSDLAQFSPAAFHRDDFYVLVCSTYGDGDAPASAVPFVKALAAEAPDLDGVRFAVFGMGDSSYTETYCRGSDVVSDLLEKHGAQRIGEHGRHDASGRDHPTDLALEWLESILPLALTSGDVDLEQSQAA
jgi:MioC protein